MSTQRIIQHVDIDSFYPSVEIRENPKLRSLPVVVGSDPKEGKGRGVVVSPSYEARKYGIHSGQPISRAYRLCPDATFIHPPNFGLYGRVSTEIMALIRTFTTKFEQVSIDEAFLDVTDKANNYEEAVKIASRIKKALFEEQGFTCSIGIAPNKSTAKIASEFKKPNGLTSVEPASVKKFLAPLHVSAITGVGRKTEIFLKGKGIETIGQLQKIEGKTLVRYFGKGGVWLWGVAQGLEQIEVKERTVRKSLSLEHTFEFDVDDVPVVIRKMKDLADHLHRRLIMNDLEFMKVGIRIRFGNFQTFTRERSLNSPTNQKDVIVEHTRKLFGEFEKRNQKIRLIGLRVSGLSKRDLQKKGLDSFLTDL
ncbi:MAG: DNA polymerase IV [Nitrososphaerales archaeon]